MSLVLKNCLIQNKNSDLLIQEGEIKKIGEFQAKAQVIDCTGLTLLPGLIDGHVHFREPGFAYKEDWQTGSRAAAKGGVTTVLDMPNTNPPTTDQESLDSKRMLARKSIVNYGFHFGATVENINLIKSIKRIAGVKIYFGSTTGNLLLNNLADLKKLFPNSDQLFLVHAEDEQVIKKNQEKYKNKNNPIIHTKIRTPEAASRAVTLLLDLIEETGARVHFCHISTAKELELIADAKQKGLKVTCEVTPHHLFLTEDEYEKQGNFVKMNPPLRTEKDRESLWQGIKKGIIDTIATDHAPHSREEKERDYWQAPAGVPGLETVLALLLNEVNKGTLTIEELMKLTSGNPAKIFNLSKKGKIEEGFDADLVLVDLSLEKEVNNKDLETKCGWSPFQGRKLKGWPVKTIIRRNLVFDSPQILENIKAQEVNYAKL